MCKILILVSTLAFVLGVAISENGFGRLNDRANDARNVERRHNGNLKNLKSLKISRRLARAIKPTRRISRPKTRAFWAVTAFMAEKCCYDNAPCSPDVRDEWDKGRTKETTSEALCYLVKKDPKNCRVNSKNDRYEPCVDWENWHGGHSWSPWRPEQGVA